jgi:hypothetical protein
VNEIANSVRKCRECGCTEEKDCPLLKQRHWAAQDWCSACRDRHPGHRMVLRQQTSGLRHYVDEKPVKCDAWLEVRIDRAWVLVRYEWTCHRNDSPLLYTGAGKLLPNPDARYRWPEDA